MTSAAPGVSPGRSSLVPGPGWSGLGHSGLEFEVSQKEGGWGVDSEKRTPRRKTPPKEGLRADRARRPGHIHGLSRTGVSGTCVQCGC